MPSIYIVEGLLAKRISAINFLIIYFELYFSAITS